MISDKKSVQFLYKFCQDLGIVDWVISPGSRNSPITLTFAKDPQFNANPVVDERSAAFIALGKSLRTGLPSAISCTSGSAALNYSPAISEAFYQEIPLLVVTADRPQRWIGNGEGQSIDQVNVFKNYCLASFHLNEDDSAETMIKIFTELSAKLFGKKKGPVHLNLAFEEPLYNQVEIPVLPSFSKPNFEELREVSLDMIKEYNSKSKVMILVGQMEEDENLEYLLGELLTDKRMVVLTETNANLTNFKFVGCIDRTLPSIENSEFHPELVITLGGAIVSKRIKKYLRSISGLEHWHLSPSGTFPDVFECLIEKIEIAPDKFFRSILKNLKVDEENNYQNIWVQRSMINKGLHEAFVEKVGWSDLKAHSLINQWLPDGAVLHQGNSSVVRYYQLFDPINTVSYQSNRGVSGIDGIVSTAVGYASNDERLNVVVVGDLSFQYDVNALWNRISKKNLLIIIINNGGGGIFKIIDGPTSTGVFDEYFEVKSDADLRQLSLAFQMNYNMVDSASGLGNRLQEVVIEFQNKAFGGGILEVNTRGVASHEILSNYFEIVNSQ